MNPDMLTEEIQLRIFKLGKLKEIYHDDPEFCTRQDTRIAGLQQILKARENIEKQQIHRAARHQRKAFSRSFRGSCQTKRSAFFRWSHARNSLFFKGAI